MKSPRPPAKSRLPRVRRRGGCGQSMRRSGQPSGAVQLPNRAPAGWARLSNAVIKHDPEKWAPLFRLKHAAAKGREHRSSIGERCSNGRLRFLKQVRLVPFLMQGGISWILIVLLAAALVVAAVGDWRSRMIPNRLNAAIALLAIPFWWANGLSL